MPEIEQQDAIGVGCGDIAQILRLRTLSIPALSIGPEYGRSAHQTVSKTRQTMSGATGRLWSQRAQDRVI
ncbi:hypothetical protein ACSSV4_003643 [Roseovarius sp. MBR-154]|jgi:hypothetical protein